MRTNSLFGVAALLMVATALTAADPLTGLRFADGKSHSYDDFSKQTLIVVHFCSH